MKRRRKKGLHSSLLIETKLQTTITMGQKLSLVVEAEIEAPVETVRSVVSNVTLTNSDLTVV